eukprot:685084-Pelagomonas_calceolata.AAC.2
MGLQPPDHADTLPLTLANLNCCCYGIPPLRPGTTGHRSGDWLVSSKIFTGRLKVRKDPIQSQICKRILIR